MESNNNGTARSRRELIKGAAGLGAAGLGAAGLGTTIALGQPAAGKRIPMRFDDPEWNRDAWARLQGNLDFGKVKYGSYSGVICGVRDGEAVRPLMNYEGFSAARLIDNGDGSYQKLLREVVYYKDLETGEIIETFDNPYTNEKVRVVQIANDPFNHMIEKYYPKGPSYGGLIETEQTRRPLLFPWKITKPDTVTLSTDIHLYYPSALQPDEWPRESAGEFVRVSEMFRYIISVADMENPDKTSVEYTGSWTRITPWFPWMLMGQAPGHMVYMGIMGGYDNLDMMSDDVRAYAEKHHPKYFDAPTEWVEPSFSSLEDYARTQKPAPAKDPAE